MAKSGIFDDYGNELDLDAPYLPLPEGSPYGPGGGTGNQGAGSSGPPPVTGSYGTYGNYGAITDKEAGDPEYNRRQAEFERQTDWAAIERGLRAEAARRGVEYDPSDLADIQRNAGYDASHQGASGGYAAAIDRAYARAMEKYDQRMGNTPGSGSQGGGGSQSVSSGSGGSGGQGYSGGGGNWAGGSGYSGSSNAPDIPAPWTGKWQAPDPSALNTDPGFRFRLAEGIKALQRSAASRGTLLTGGTLKGLNDYAQDSASQEYGNIYDRSYNDYETGRRDFMTNEANRYGAQRTNRNDDWGMTTDQYGMDRQTRMDDFNIWDTLDRNEWNRRMDLGRLATPPYPNAPVYPY